MSIVAQVDNEQFINKSATAVLSIEDNEVAYIALETLSLGEESSTDNRPIQVKVSMFRFD